MNEPLNTYFSSTNRSTDLSQPDGLSDRGSAGAPTDHAELQPVEFRPCCRPCRVDMSWPCSSSVLGPKTTREHITSSPAVDVRAGPEEAADRGDRSGNGLDRSNHRSGPRTEGGLGERSRGDALRRWLDLTDSSSVAARPRVHWQRIHGTLLNPGFQVLRGIDYKLYTVVICNYKCLALFGYYSCKTCFAVAGVLLGDTIDAKIHDCVHLIHRRLLMILQPPELKRVEICFFYPCLVGSLEPTVYSGPNKPSLGAHWVPIDCASLRHQGTRAVDENCPRSAYTGRAAWRFQPDQDAGDWYTRSGFRMKTTEWSCGWMWIG